MISRHDKFATTLSGFIVERDVFESAVTIFFQEASEVGYLEDGYKWTDIDQLFGYDGTNPICCGCSREIEIEACYVDPNGSVVCYECYDQDRVLVESPERIEEAVAECEILFELDEYHRSKEWRPTHEEYGMGLREAYTPNAYVCYCRHGCTNYDSLIRDLDRSDPVDQAVYSAIRERIDELVNQLIRSSNTPEVAEYIIDSTFEPAPPDF